MSLVQLTLRSLRFFWRTNAAVSLGVAAATAVLTGALLVGDSVRGSLRALTLDRLGTIDDVLIADRFFREQLATELARSPNVQATQRLAAGILFPNATLERPTDQQTTRASSVLVLGCNQDFWAFDTGTAKPHRLPGANEIVLNESLARELGVQVDDLVTLRLPKMDQVPADSALANKNDRVRGVPGLKVIEIIPAKGLGQFSLQASQSLPNNAFLSLETLQAALNQPQKINAIFVDHKLDSRAATDTPSLQPTLDDAGITIKHVSRSYRSASGEERNSIDYFSVTTDRMVFSPDAAEILKQGLPAGSQPVLTYLANSIERVTKSEDRADRPGIPYSMVTGVDFTNDFSMTDADNKAIDRLADNEIVLNEWAASDLNAKIGDLLRIRYFEPETTHGQAVESSREFTLKAIAGLTKPVQPFRRNRAAQFDRPLTPATDPNFTPEVAGVTDQDTIDAWDPPFPFDHKRVREVDEEYWDNHRTTPKAFVSYATAQRIWGSRFGSVTSFRVPASVDQQQLSDGLNKQLTSHAEKFGFQFIPIRQRQLAASGGTTPFDALFLSLSFFVIAAALMMVSLLFRLGIEQRFVQIGTLLAVGFTHVRVRRSLVGEGVLISAIGALLGVFLGLLYARLMLAGLTNWWLGAITTPFLTFHYTWRSLVLGYVLGVIISALTIAWTIRRTKHISVRQLLGGQLLEPVVATGSRMKWLTIVCIAVALILSVVATRLGGMAQAGAFVGSGTLLLIGLLLWIRSRLRSDWEKKSASWSSGSVVWQLALRSISRNPGRSVITIGLMASATFLIVAMSSFRLRPTAQGVGGFELIAQSSEPIYVDLDEPQRRAEYFASQADSLTGVSILGLRLRAGDDASCNNLYQASQPRVLGVPDRFVNHFDRRDSTSFEWGGSAAASADERSNPWRLLSQPTNSLSDPVPVVLDKNTAMFSLKLYRGIGEEFEFMYDGRPTRFRVVGLLVNSVLQGTLLIGETNFQRHFPQLSGYRYFLVDAPPEKVKPATQLLEDRFSDQGLDAKSADEVLSQLLAVQNTYLSTFQSLGALGLLLGTFGLATVQLRNVLERRGELALLRAAGYRRQRLAKLVLLENIALLAGGLITGVVAALLAVLPHQYFGETAISWALLRDLAVMLLAVLAAGLASSLISVRAVLRLPLLASLRGE